MLAKKGEKKMKGYDDLILAKIFKYHNQDFRAKELVEFQEQQH